MDKISFRNPSKSKLNVQSHIIGKHIRDVSSSWIAGITLLPPNDLLLADWNNACVKQVHADTSDITDYLQLSSDPWDITTLGNDQAAVTSTMSRRYSLSLLYQSYHLYMPLQ